MHKKINVRFDLAHCFPDLLEVVQVMATPLKMEEIDVRLCYIFNYKLFFKFMFIFQVIYLGFLFLLIITISSICFILREGIMFRNDLGCLSA